MSAINIIMHNDAVHMITDGAGFRKNDMTWESPKVMMMPHLNAVMSCTGPALQAPLILSVIGTLADTYDGVKALLRQRTREAIQDLIRPLASLFPDPRFVFVIAGISETSGPDAYLIHNLSTMPLPWVAQDIGPVSMVPMDNDTVAAFHAEFPDLDGAESLDPERHGLRMLELQRLNPDFGIGGFAQLTSVARHGISTRIIHHWKQTPSARRII